MITRVGVAADEAAGGTVLVQFSAAPATAEAVFAALWEPILSSIKVGAAAAAESSQLDMLTGPTWQWGSFTDPVQQFEVEQSEAYTLTFQPDGALQIRADCNMASAAYAASEDGSLSVQPGVTTLAACPPGSRGEEFVQKLGFAVIYFFQDGHLFIDLMADGGTLEFSPQ